MAKEKMDTPDVTDVEAVRLEIKELLERAKETAADIIDDARKKAREIVDGASSTAAATSEEVLASIQRGEEMCEVTLFRDNNKYAGDVYISVNGENCVIKRGIPVKIKRKFKEVLENSQYQDMMAADTQRELSEGFEKKTRELG